MGLHRQMWKSVDRCAIVWIIHVENSKKSYHPNLCKTSTRKQQGVKLSWKLDISHFIFVRKSALFPFLFMHFRACFCPCKVNVSGTFLWSSACFWIFFFVQNIQYPVGHLKPWLLDHSVRFGCNLMWWISHVTKAFIRNVTFLREITSAL